MLFVLSISAFLIPLSLGFDESLADAPCGGDVMNKTSITMPSHKANVTCVWRFTSPKTRRYFAVTHFQLSPGAVLLVYDSDYKNGTNTSSVAGTLIGNFTGKMDPFLIVTFANVSTIVFQSGPNPSNNSNFMIQFQTNNCLLFVKAPSGGIRSPVFRPASAGTLLCTYHLQTDDPKGKVVLSFDKVNLPKGEVIIWDGVSKNGSSIVTNATGPLTSVGDVVSSSQSLLIETLLPTSAVENFTASFFTANHACPKGMVSLKKAVYLTSPGYPANYPSSLDCRFVISAPEGATVAVDVDDVDMGDDVDDVILNDGDTKSAPLLVTLNAGYKKGGLLLTSGNKLWVRMRTDESRSGRGFRIRLTPSIFSGASRFEGRFEIHDHGNQTDTNDTSAGIYHLLFAKSGMQVEVTRNASFLMPLSTIEFRDGTSVNSSLIGFFRSSEPFYPVVSSAGCLLLIVRGFIRKSLMQQFIIADFSSVYPGNQTSLSGVSGSAALLESDFSGSATYVVINPHQDRLVALAISELYLPPGASVVIYRGASAQSIQFVKYTTGPGEDPAKVIPVLYTPQARIEYRMTGKPVVKPDKILLRFSYRTLPGCDGFELSKESGGNLTSPQYPNWYPANAYCRWTFTPVQNKHLRLSFSDVSLAANHSLKIEADHYTIRPIGNATVQKMTSQTLDILTHDVTNLSDILVLMNNNSLNTTKVKVTFDARFKGKRSDLEVSSGFKITYEHLMCGGNITDPSQPISTPGFPGPVTGRLVRCVWMINLPQRPATSSSSVNIVKFKVNIKHSKKSSKKSKSVLEVRDGGSQRAPLFPVTIQDGDTKELLSRTNVVWLLYSFTQSKAGKDAGPSVQVHFSAHVCAKADQCANGVCMHNDWRCNGKDECGDDSDEVNCFHATNTVSRLVLGMSILLTFIIAIALACIVPYLYKRFKYPNYSQLRDLMTPVPT